jgi:hypothetical protein
MSKRIGTPIVALVGLALALSTPACENPGGGRPMGLTWQQDGDLVHLQASGTQVGYLVVGTPAEEPGLAQQPGPRVFGGEQMTFRAPVAVYELQRRLDCPPGVECNPCLPGNDCPPVPPPPMPRQEGVEMVWWLPGHDAQSSR